MENKVDTGDYLNKATSAVGDVFSSESSKNAYQHLAALMEERDATRKRLLDTLTSGPVKSILSLGSLAREFGSDLAKGISNSPDGKLAAIAGMKGAYSSLKELEGMSQKGAASISFIQEH